MGLVFFVFLQITNFVIDPDFLHHLPCFKNCNLVLVVWISCTIFFTAPYFATDFVIHLDFLVVNSPGFLKNYKLVVDPVLFAKLQFLVDSNILQNQKVAQTNRL